MEKLTSRFRLTSTAFMRKDEENKIEPKRMIILSVEGDETERTYFQHLNTHLDRAIIQIEVLRHRRGDGYSDPHHVIELLNEYVEIRQGQLIPEELPESFAKKYSRETIDAYLKNDDSLPSESRTAISEALVKIGIDLEYRRYLQSFDKETDFFAVVLDRDCGNHSRALMEECYKFCAENGYGCFVTNPCFEFWLLLHLCDVKTNYTGEELKRFKDNPKISNQHTVISREVSTRAHHGKRIGADSFDKYYFPRIADALLNVNQFKTSYPDVLDDLGSNLPQLFGELGIQ